MSDGDWLRRICLLAVFDGGMGGSPSPMGEGHDTFVRVKRLVAERDQLRAALVRKIRDYSELWQECNELRAQVKTLLNEIERITNDY